MSALPSMLVSFDQKSKFRLVREMRLSRLPPVHLSSFKVLLEILSSKCIPLVGHNYEFCSFLTKIFDPDRIQSSV